jgi:streptolysin S family bacteriocin protoxin
VLMDWSVTNLQMMANIFQCRQAWGHQVCFPGTSCCCTSTACLTSILAGHPAAEGIQGYRPDRCALTPCCEGQSTLLSWLDYAGQTQSPPRMCSPQGLVQMPRGPPGLQSRPECLQ